MNFNMNFNMKRTLLYSDTLLPDIFISDYLPDLDGDSLKVYIYCIFLSKYAKTFNKTDLAQRLHISENTIKKHLDKLQSLGLIIQTDNAITFNDLKERTVLANYRPIESSDPDTCLSTIRNKKRNKVIRSINEEFFNGVMATSWYTDIDSWFDRFHFEDDAMYMLFQHCSKHLFEKKYILSVAEKWHSRGVVTSLDVEKYCEEYKRVKNISYKISKKLNRKAPLTSYEETMIEEWVMDFGYDIDIIDFALQKTTGTSNPNFNFINTILKGWHKANLHTLDEVATYSKTTKKKQAKNTAKQFNNKITYKNFEQRNYDDSYFESFYHNPDAVR